MDTVESGTKSKDAWVNAIASRCSYSFIDSKLSIRQRATAPPIRTSCRLLSVCQFSNPLRGHFSRACGLATVSVRSRMRPRAERLRSFRSSATIRGGRNATEEDKAWAIFSDGGVRGGGVRGGVEPPAAGLLAGP